MSKRKTSVKKTKRDAHRMSSPKQFKDNSILRLVHDYTGLRVDRKILPKIGDHGLSFTEKMIRQLVSWHKQNFRQYRSLNKEAIDAFLNKSYPKHLEQMEQDNQVMIEGLEAGERKSKYIYLQRNPMEQLFRELMKPLYDETINSKASPSKQRDRAEYRLSNSGIDAMKHAIEVEMKFHAVSLSYETKRVKHRTIKDKLLQELERKQEYTLDLPRYSSVTSLGVSNHPIKQLEQERKARAYRLETTKSELQGLEGLEGVEASVSDDTYTPQVQKRQSLRSLSDDKTPTFKPSTKATSSIKYTKDKTPSFPRGKYMDLFEDGEDDTDYAFGEPSKDEEASSLPGHEYSSIFGEDVVVPKSTSKPTTIQRKTNIHDTPNISYTPGSSTSFTPASSSTFSKSIYRPFVHDENEEKIHPSMKLSIRSKRTLR